jgi:endonuclease G
VPVIPEAALRAAVARIESSDASLARELRGVRDRGGVAVGDRTTPDPRGVPGRDDLRLSAQIQLETIVLRVGRPVFAIVEDRARLDARDSESEVWRQRLEASSDRLAAAARAVGRVNVSGHPLMQWVGTGWLVADRTIVTNRHVAREFGRRSGDRFTFTSISGSPVRSSIDFLQEVDRDDTREFQVMEILHIEDDEGPDVALLRVETTSGGPALANPIPLAPTPVPAGRQIVVMGYPARDSRIPDSALMQAIFGDVYDRKRLAPGQVLSADAALVTHDCSTLGGNSGSVVLDLESGQAVALHFAGRFLKANSAVPAALVADRVAALTRQGSVTTPARPPAPTGDASTEDEDFVEARPADYIGRRGYDSAFLGTEIALPTVANAADVLTFTWEGATERVLAYQHFSVVMSRARRMCLFSAANIDGARIRRVKRAPWRLDPRIAADQQIRDECYGNPPRFSRGHMTRRADPVWGDPTDAARANADSMHVTNTVPQLQPFNAGLWLGLEDYALDHAMEDAMRLAVFTGPFLLPDDAIRFGVQVPRSFWKVIAFIHDETGELSATGYVMSQAALMGDEEFVYGPHETSQVPIASIERQAGLTFPALAGRDPFTDAESRAVPLTDFRQIRFRA